MGQDEYELKSLTDAELLSGLERVVGRRNQITAEFLAYLAELDERQLFLDLGYYPFGYHEARSSLFEYCVEKLGLCESTAGRHIAAARVCRNHPAAFGMVASGALHASALSLMRKHLTSENAGELFALCSRRSARKVEELVAARFPRPDVRDLVRRLPARTEATLDVERSTEHSAATQASREWSSARDRAPVEAEVETVPTEALSHSPSTASAKGRGGILPQGVPGTSGVSKPRRIEPLSADRFGVHFTADGEFCALLERVRSLAGHRLPSGDLMTLLKRGLEAYERQLEKERFGVGRKARRSRQAESEPETPSPDPNPNPAPKPIHNRTQRRHCPAEGARAVFVRDGRQCTYVSPDGRRCGARRCLELDHIDPFVVGCKETIQNLRLRCRAHNQWYARQYFGSKHMHAAMQHARRSRAAPRGSASDQLDATARDTGDESHFVPA